MVELKGRTTVRPTLRRQGSPRVAVSKKTTARYRPVARPALRPAFFAEKPSRLNAVFRRVRPFFAPTGGVFVVFVLFQIFSAPIALGYYESPTVSRFPTAALNRFEWGPFIDEAPAAEPVGLPARITIPSIGVDAAISAVGLTPDGSMGLPKLPSDTAWYKLGVKPGEKGSAVIAGHLNWWYGVTGVFARLNALKPGNTISVRDERGALVDFIVRESRRFDAAADATEIFTSKDGQAHLNIITRDGSWDKRAKQYSKRLVVFADKVAE